MNSDDLKNSIDTEIDFKIKQFSMSHWPFVAWRLRHFWWNKPIEEIYYDWCTVHGFADRIKERLKSSDPYGEIDGLPYMDVRHNYTQMMAYLWLAKGERDPGLAWNLVNSADKLLPLVIDSEAFSRSVIRLRAWDERLFELNPKSKDLLAALDADCEATGKSSLWNEKVPEDIARELDRMVTRIKTIFRSDIVTIAWTTEIPDEVKKVLNEMLVGIQDVLKAKSWKDVWKGETYDKLVRVKDETKEKLDTYLRTKTSRDLKETEAIKWLKESIDDTFRCVEVMYTKRRGLTPQVAPAAPVGVKGPPGPTSRTKRCMEYCKQANRAQLWYKVNARITLRYALWLYYAKMLLLFTMVGIAALEFAFFMLNPDTEWWYRPFLGMWLLGLFGAAVSTKVIKREIVKETTSVQLIRMLAIVRVLTGGAGAVIIYLFIGAGMLSNSFSESVMNNLWVFGLAGVVAGFTEQLFVGALDSASKKLEIVS